MEGGLSHHHPPQLSECNLEKITILLVQDKLD